MRVSPNVDRGLLGIDELRTIAMAALAAAGRPPWGNPLVVALELGFRMLPCMPGSAPEFERSTAEEIVFAAEAGEAHSTRVRLALARGLLLRAGVRHDPADVGTLARLLRQFPE